MFTQNQTQERPALRSRTLVTLLASFAALFVGSGLGVRSAAAATTKAPRVGHGHYRAVCPARRGHARCESYVVTDKDGRPLVRSRPRAPHGGSSPDQTLAGVNCWTLTNQVCLSPSNLHTAYQLPWSSPVPQTIAVVDAYDHPNAKADLDAFDSAWGLGAFASCSGPIVSGCFQRVDENGRTAGFANSDPAEAAQWNLETNLDVQYAHGTCLNCKILLVEASTDSPADLAAAANTAANLGATEISNSYAWIESKTPVAYDAAYMHPGVAITASAGDWGYGAYYPADLNTVVAVGGTRLNINTDGSYNSESAWGNGVNAPSGSGTGSGCSIFTNSFSAAPTWQISDPSWQYTGCGTRRSIADVSADADPVSGVWVYSSVTIPGYGTKTGWFGVGGTSLAAPVIAGVYALAGNAGRYSWPAQIPYLYRSNLHDVTTGTNGSCSYYIMCHAWSGYDGPTGLGTPSGLGAF